MRVQKHKADNQGAEIVVQLLKSWEYKNGNVAIITSSIVVQLLKSWEYKNSFYCDGTFLTGCTVT